MINFSPLMEGGTGLFVNGSVAMYGLSELFLLAIEIGQGWRHMIQIMMIYEDIDDGGDYSKIFSIWIQGTDWLPLIMSEIFL